VRVVVVGSGFSGSLLARILVKLGREVVLLERGSHPRFAIGESTTPLANLALERIARRYDLADCRDLAAHGRWLARYPELRRGLKRGFTFYRHQAGAADLPERLLVAANPSEEVADTHWLRADVDHHFMRRAVAAGVEYHDRTRIVDAAFETSGVTLRCVRDAASFDVHADFLIDASGPDGFVARHLSIPSPVDRMHTTSGVLFSHFENVGLLSEAFPSFPQGPYADDWAAVHHIIDEGWMYSLRFDDNVVSAGFVLRNDCCHPERSEGPAVLWRSLLHRYPTISALFANAKPLFPLVYRDRIQHRLAQSVGPRWVLLPHAYSFVDPLFSTGIAWTLRAIERLALSFEADGLPTAADLSCYDALLSAEADQIDVFIAGAYEAMKRFDLFAAHSMIYFATVSYAEVRQRVVDAEADRAPWSGFLGVGDPVLESLPSESLRRLRSNDPDFSAWVRDSIARRNIAGLADDSRNNLYPLDLDVLLDRHALLGMTRDELVARLPALRGVS
jgi:FADH2 O2-dependent halogenase